MDLDSSAMHDLFVDCQGDLALSRDDGHEEDTKGDGGYRFDTAQHKEEIKRQRVEMWNWLKQVGAA